MNCIPNKKALIQKRINNEIERQLQKDKCNAGHEVKILLMGRENSGKSSLIKQMRIIYGLGYSDEDKRRSKKFVYQNILIAMQNMIHAMDMFKMSYSDPRNSKNAELVHSIDHEMVTTFDSHLLEAIKQLWADSGIQECYNSRKEYKLSDSAKYFLSNIDRIGATDYLPTLQDILRIRIPTTSITEYMYEDNTTIYRMIDTGGQSSERRKWINCFENINSMIFLVDLSEYNQIENGLNRMEKSKELFKEMVTSPLFQNNTIILFLNKKDVFEENIKYSNLVDYFPEYDGPVKDAIHAREYIGKMFWDLNPVKEKVIFVHYTCAIDTKHIRFIFGAVNEFLKFLQLYSSSMHPHFLPLESNYQLLNPNYTEKINKYYRCPSCKRIHFL